MLPRSLLVLLLAGFWGSLPLPARSQLLPDDTLGAESSLVTPLNPLSDRIDGGAMRGANLFHSFQEFNVGTGREVFFSTPAAIANILTRVTGGNSSDILGKLGVLGDANLWLINPNGIYFGPDAKLDMRGSFVATTADGVGLGDTGYFSATDIDGSQLLAIEPGALFNHALATHQGKIINRGNLRVEGDLTLAAGNLDLMGEIEAGKDLRLQAIDTLKIRDRPQNPFIAKAGGELLVQGNENVDIFALNHPDSGLFSGEDLILKSRNPVLGDIHYYSGEDFRILNPNTNALEGLESPWDPVIRAAGDVSLASYTGASLHILAGGSVTITGDINITGVDATDGLQETVTLSDGTTLAIDGRSVPTLDIRAGITNFGMTGCTGTCPTFTEGSASSADIAIGGDIAISSFGGQVFLSTQYSPNTALSGGNITLNSINENDTQGQDVIIDTRNNLTVGGFINTTATNANAGDVTILASNAIAFSETNKTSRGISTGFFGTTNGFAGDIRINTGSLEVSNGAQIGAFNFGQGTGADVSITASDTIRFQGSNPGTIAGIDTSSLIDTTLSSATGNAGNITINAGTLELLDGARISTTAEGQGSSGNITINATNLTALNGSQIAASTSGGGNAGNITITASETVLLQGTSSSGDRSGVGSAVSANATGNAGNIAISANTLNLLDLGGITAATQGAGNGGDITLTAETGLLQNNGVISASTTSSGNAGDLTLNINQFELDNSQGNEAEVNEGGIFVVSQGSGEAGNINITGANLTLRNTSEISTNSDTVNGGDITINLSEVLLLRNASEILTESGTDDINGGGNGGNITISANFVVAVPGENSDIRANAFFGNGGNITINASAIYGIEFRTAQTSFSDITASSQFGQNGLLVFNPLNFPSEQGLNELPDSLVDAESIIGRDACALEDGRIAGGSSFTITGRGGIPANPEDPLTNAPYVPEWSDRRGEGDRTAVILRENPKKLAAIQPVQGWYVAADGTVHLTADALTPTPQVSSFSHPPCHAFSQ